tara:strand:+ start:79 stop:555 length:477 start_codon:yes stop_codon:yes gene_type:complete
MAEISFKSAGEKFSSIQDRDSRNRVQLPIGIATPLRVSTTQKDIFEMHYKIEDQVTDNLRNLILTNHGERLGHYDFGANLRPILFDLTSTDFESEAMSRISTSVKKYMPFVTLETFELEVDNRNTSRGLATYIVALSYGIPAANSTGHKMKVALTVGG